ncbi:MAG TPA: BadF/BadG/BcrA/BcrD ATPase family protein [Terriglobales bacterium]|nr:BadF/BadG/BcrA/BcrD ATPase family protein [Terriglobales bacterium]
MAYYLGIDGGGTKTRCVLGDETMVLATAMSGGSNIVRLGETQAKEALHAAVRQVCVTANISPAQISAICIGAAGAARPEIAAKTRTILVELISEIAPEITLTRIEVVGDMTIALEAAFGAGPGVIAIAGTGSIVYGRDAAGRIARAGGWGFAISDEGSGHWIGRRAISALLGAHDQGLETALTAMILQAWKLTTLGELVQQANSTPPPDFPRLFPIVLRAADEGDPIAGDLLTDAGAKLGSLAATVVRRLAPHAPSAALPGSTLPVAMTGSVFRQSPHVRQVFYNTLQTALPGLDVRQEIVDPIEGALARARAAQ